MCNTADNLNKWDNGTISDPVTITQGPKLQIFIQNFDFKRARGVYDH
jgi:hypothetical protein